MSKTIEIVSRHTGKVGICTRKGEQRKIVFEDKGGGVGFAMCDEDEAEILLGSIGLPDYWKPGQRESASSTPVQIPTVPATPDSNPVGGEGGGEGGEGDQESGKGEGEGAGEGNEGKTLTKEGYDSIKNAGELQALLQTTEDAALIMELVAVEAQRDPSRSTWMKALNDRLEELKK